MDEIKAGLQYAFQTESKYTLLISGTGHAGMELCLANMLEPGQKVIIGNNGDDLPVDCCTESQACIN